MDGELSIMKSRSTFVVMACGPGPPSPIGPPLLLPEPELEPLPELDPDPSSPGPPSPLARLLVVPPQAQMLEHTNARARPQVW
jgi:hypothetical protein